MRISYFPLVNYAIFKIMTVLYILPNSNSAYLLLSPSHSIKYNSNT